MELLASIHWLSNNQNTNKLPDIIAGIKNWNPRKAQLMKTRHIEKAWHHLSEQGWIEDKLQAQ